MDVETERNLNVRFERPLLLWATIIVVVLYGWVVSRFTRHELVLPASLVSWSIVQLGGEKKPFQEAPFAVRARVAQGIEKAEAVLEVLRGLRHPIGLTIHMDEPLRYLVTEASVEIGKDIVDSKGQLLKAFLKIWLLQNADPDLTSSLARLEIVSDVLQGVLRGEFDLYSPFSKRVLALDDATHWLQEASSFQGVCLSPWRSLEITPLCDNLASDAQDNHEPGAIHELSFRRLLTSILFASLRMLPVRERLTAVRAWSGALREEVEPRDEINPVKITDWGRMIRSEINSLLPLARMSESEKFKGELAQRLERILKNKIARAGLTDEGPIQATVWITALGANGADLRALALAHPCRHEIGDRWRALSRPWFPEKALRPGFSNGVEIIETADGIYSLPGLARLSAAVNGSEIRTRILVWEDCFSPSFAALVSHRSKPKRILFVRNCGRSLSADYRSVWDGFSEWFGHENESVSFALLKREPAELALRRGFVRGDMTIAELMTWIPDLEPRPRASDTAAAERLSPAPMTGRRPEASMDSRRLRHLGLQYLGLKYLGLKYLGLQDAKWEPRLGAFRIVGAVEAIELVRRGRDIKPRFGEEPGLRPEYRRDSP